jgi:hypothetical protein
MADIDARKVMQAVFGQQPFSFHRVAQPRREVFQLRNFPTLIEGNPQ